MTNNANNYDDWFKTNGEKEPVAKKSPEQSSKSTKSSKTSKVKAGSTKEKLISIKEGVKSKFAKLGENKVIKKMNDFRQKSNQKIVARLKKFYDRFNEKVLLKKILYTILLLLLFRIAASITMPGVQLPEAFASDASSFLGILDLMGGGSLRQFSIVALGISPYITASILMTLLQSEVFPPIYNLARSGQAGRRKINIITRFITLILATLQAITLLQQFSSIQLSVIELLPQYDTDLYKFFVLPVILIAGSMFTLFLGEQITEKGVGNGTSLIIFSGIAAKLPSTFQNAWKEIVGSAANSSTFIGITNFLIYTAVFVLLLLIILVVYKSERHIPIQQTGAGLTTDSKQMSRLPIKLNPGGVMPIIFGLMIISLPLQIVQFFHHQNEGRIWVENNLTFTDPIGLTLMCVLIFFFSIGMGFVTFNPATIAENFKKNGTFIPGVRPGKETEEYLSSVVLRLTIFSGFYLAAITSIQYFQQIAGLSPVISFGGTTIIILVTVSVETIQQLTARETTNKISRKKASALSNVSGSTGGLLW